MKLTVLSLLVALFSSPLCAAERAPAVHAHGETALADGVVQKVDKAGGKLTVAHGPLPNGMPAMTMPFKVSNSAWLDEVRPGQKIRFAVDEVKGVSTIIRLEKAQ